MDWIEAFNLACYPLLISIVLIIYQITYIVLTGRIKNSITIARVLLLAIIMTCLLFGYSFCGMKLQKGEQVQVIQPPTGGSHGIS